jgi:hypothetical protein
MAALPSPEEFAALVAAYPDVPELPQAVPAEQAGQMVGIQPLSIRIPRDAPGGWQLGTLVRWRASLPGRGHNAGRPPADTAGFVALLRDRVAEDEVEHLTVTDVAELLGLHPKGRVARRAFVELTGRDPVHGRIAGR